MSSLYTFNKLRISLLILLCGLLIFSWLPSGASALELSDRGIVMGSALPGANTTHEFHFTYTSNTNVGSVLFEYCESPVDGVPCIAPPGIDASGANFIGQTGETGFSLLSANTNQIIITRPVSPASSTQSTYTFSNIINPDFNSCTTVVVPNCEFFGRIYTYASTDATGAFTDNGGLAASTNPTIAINSIVPPILDFCVGQTIIGTDCSTATGDIVDLGIMSPFTASSGTSQMVAATNAQFGLEIAADGTTMTAGNNTIPNLGVPTVSAPGNTQFGFNLRANTNPSVGQNPSGAGVALPTAQYNIPNEFLFNPGDVVATSPAVTDFRKFTSSYLANVPPSQAPGVYTSTITYICTASF